MYTFPAFSTLDLPARTLYSLDQADGLQLTCIEGSVWVTLDHDPRDIVLDPGESFTLSDDRRALVYAFDAARLTLRTRPEAAPAKASLRARPGTVRRSWLPA